MTDPIFVDVTLSVNLSDPLERKVIGYFETSVNTSSEIQRHIPEDRNPL